MLSYLLDGLGVIQEDESEIKHKVLVESIQQKIANKITFPLVGSYIKSNAKFVN